MIIKITSGKVVERRKSRVFSAGKKRGTRVPGSSSEKKIAGNREYATLQLARILNCNYRAADLWLTLKLDEEHLAQIGGSLEAVKKEGRKFLDRVAYRLKKRGIVLKWVLAASEIDGDTGELVRPHVHCVIPAAGIEMRDGVLCIAGEKLSDIWGKGSVDVQLLRDQDDYYPLAKYVIDQARNVPDEKKYSCSRNMEKPKVERSIVTNGGQLRVPSGATVLHGTRYEPEIGVNIVRYVPKKKDAAKKIGGHKELARALAEEDGGGGGYGL